MKNTELKKYLDAQLKIYNQSAFIKSDPISIPHQFTKPADIEIAGLFAAVFAWGNRTTIINKSNELMQLFDNSPHQFITQHSAKDLKKLLHFKHRTFNTTDLFYFIYFLKEHFKNNDSLESAFTGSHFSSKNKTVEAALIYFNQYFFSLEDAPQRTQKHIPSPLKGSTCKRLNMYLRWMVRDDGLVDFGIWKTIKPAQLICPIDIHVSRVAVQLGLLKNDKNNWQTAVELTENLKQLDKHDPVKYDIALFSIGANKF